MGAGLSFRYRLMRGLARLLTWTFFREAVCEGVERIPDDAGGLIVAWHPNGLVDPALILAHFPGRIVFGARHGLFSWPLLGWLMRGAGCVPIYRAGDTSRKSRKERLAANEASLDALSRQLAAGSYSALFPEGLSHDHPHLTDIKTGAARLYCRAVELSPPGAPLPVIIPVGLHYDRKDIFRSRVLVHFHAPISLSPEVSLAPGLEIDDDRRRELYRSVTDGIEETLVEVVRATEDWGLHHLMHRLRKLMRAERASRAGTDPGRPSIAERELGFARVWYAYQVAQVAQPEETRTLRHLIAAYDRDLQAVGLEDHELSGAPRLASPLWVGIGVLQFVAVFLLLPPILLAGYIINVIPYQALKGVNRLLAKESKDSATVKIIGGSILFPCTWAAAAFLAAKAHHELHLMFPSVPDVPVAAAATTVVLGVAGGLLATVYNELSGETWRALRVRITRRRQRDAIEALLARRADIHDRVEGVLEGLPLPVGMAEDG